MEAARRAAAEGRPSPIVYVCEVTKLYIGCPKCRTDTHNTEHELTVTGCTLCDLDEKKS